MDCLLVARLGFCLFVFLYLCRVEDLSGLAFERYGLEKAKGEGEVEVDGEKVNERRRNEGIYGEGRMELWLRRRWWIAFWMCLR